MSKKFEGQQDDEEVLHVFRRHPIVMRKGIILAGILIILGELPSLYWADMNVLIIGGLIGLFLGSLAFFYHWIGWYFSICIVTNKRLRQVSQSGLFKRSVVDIYLKRIQNVNFSISGFTETVFGFGTIIIQTIVGDMVLDTLPHPERRHAELLEALQDSGVLVDSTGDLDEV